jgi:hypothetical protein
MKVLQSVEFILLPTQEGQERLRREESWKEVYFLHQKNQENKKIPKTKKQTKKSRVQSFHPTE